MKNEVKVVKHTDHNEEDANDELEPPILCNQRLAQCDLSQFEIWEELLVNPKGEKFSNEAQGLESEPNAQNCAHHAFGEPVEQLQSDHDLQTRGKEVA